MMLADVMLLAGLFTVALTTLTGLSSAGSWIALTFEAGACALLAFVLALPRRGRDHDVVPVVLDEVDEWHVEVEDAVPLPRRRNVDANGDGAARRGPARRTTGHRDHSPE